jgi:hypothetical protein
MISWIKDKVPYLMILTFLLIIVVISLVCCKTQFKPIWEDRLPAECNMTLNTYRLYYNSADKSAVMPSSDFCYKKLHRLFCQGEVYGYDEKGNPNPVDYNDSKKYRDYSQCMSELK